MSEREPTPLPGEPAFWTERWRTGETRWDLGKCYPGLDELLAVARRHGLMAPGAAVLEPGAGRAHTGAELARRGYVVTAFDLVPAAIGAARELYGKLPTLTLTEADALAINAAWIGRFAGVFDRAMLCALPREAKLRPVGSRVHCWAV